MRYFLDFLHQKAPKSGKDMPAYYRDALFTSALLFVVYYLVCLLLLLWANQRFELMPLLLCVLTAFSLPYVKRSGPRVNLAVSTVITCVWCYWFVHYFGWGAGVQHFLIPLLMLMFFNIYESPAVKIIYTLCLIIFRMLMYSHSLEHAPVFSLDSTELVVIQTFNSVALYVILALLCIRFSTSTQATERQLRIDNQELHKEADTDPLTHLPNRRAMTDEISRFLNKSPDQPFGVAIADIDFFKKVNDTYGHNCGDYTLRVLADKFREMAAGNYKICRWGGEEFCFFLPDMNLDQAGAAMHDLCAAVKQMPLSFDGHDFSITITIGVSENDFHSPMETILEEADRKLYMGKNNGRDQVVI